MGPDRRTLVEKALAHDAAALRELVDLLAPVVERSVLGALWRTSGNRDVRQEVADMSQEVFASLFSADGKALRAWDPARGMALEGFVGLLARHQVASILRNGRTSPWRDEPTADEHLMSVPDPAAGPDAAAHSRDQLQRLLEEVTARLSPRGLEIFERLIIDEAPVDSVAQTMGMTRDALYQWKSRLLRMVHDMARAINDQTLSDGPTSPRKEGRGSPP